jgi:hypothetical protein
MDAFICGQTYKYCEVALIGELAEHPVIFWIWLIWLLLALQSSVIVPWFFI